MKTTFVLSLSLGLFILPISAADTTLVNNYTAYDAYKCGTLHGWPKIVDLNACLANPENYKKDLFGVVLKIVHDHDLEKEGKNRLDAVVRAGALAESPLHVIARTATRKMLTESRIYEFMPAGFSYHTRSIETPGIRGFLNGNGWNINVRDSLGRTPLYDATLFGDLTIVEDLIFNGADVTIPDLQGRTPLYALLENKKNYTPEQLKKIYPFLDKGVRLDKLNTVYKGAKKRALLHLIAENAALQQLDAVKKLYWYSSGEKPGYLDRVVEKSLRTTIFEPKKWNINVQDSLGKTPLMAAAWVLNQDMVKTFLNHGAHTQAKDNKGKTVIDLLRFRKNLLLKKLNLTEDTYQEKIEEKKKQDEQLATEDIQKQLTPRKVESLRLKTKRVAEPFIKKIEKIDEIIDLINHSGGTIIR